MEFRFDLILTAGCYLLLVLFGTYAHFTTGILKFLRAGFVIMILLLCLMAAFWRYHDARWEGYLSNLREKRMELRQSVIQSMEDQGLRAHQAVQIKFGQSFDENSLETLTELALYYMDSHLYTLYFKDIVEGADEIASLYAELSDMEALYEDRFFKGLRQNRHSVFMLFLVSSLATSLWLRPHSWLGKPVGGLPEHSLSEIN